MADITITVSGPVGSGKSALCKEIEILCRALGVPCKWEGGQKERNLSGGDSHDELAMYEPRVTLRERHDRPVGHDSGPHPADCPHADPFRICEECAVSPCPIGLGGDAAAGKR